MYATYQPHVRVLHDTHTGPFMDATQPTGRTFAYPLANFAQIEGDKIRWEQVYLDRRAAAEQLGLNPSSASPTTEPPSQSKINEH